MLKSFVGELCLIVKFKVEGKNIILFCLFYFYFRGNVGRIEN